MIEVFITPQPFFSFLSYNLRSTERKTPEKVLIPSMSILSVIGIKKLSRRNTVKKSKPAELSKNYIKWPKKG
jgi:hypothetical protein